MLAHFFNVRLFETYVVLLAEFGRKADRLERKVNLLIRD
jgi:hypothetical protein